MSLKCEGCGKPIGVLINLQDRASDLSVPEGFSGSGQCPYCGRKFYIHASVTKVTKSP